jgi:hypothetical protein
MNNLSPKTLGQKILSKTIVNLNCLVIQENDQRADHVMTTTNRRRLQSVVENYEVLMLTRENSLL